MEKLFVIALLVANFAALSRAQNPSPAPFPPAAVVPPQNQGAVVAASPVPAPAPVLETKLVVSILEQKLAVVVNDKVEVFNWITVGTEVAISDKPMSRAVKELADDKRLMATNTTKTSGKNRTGSVIEGRAQEKTNTL